MVTTVWPRDCRRRRNVNRAADRFPLPAELDDASLIAVLPQVTGRAAELEVLEDMDPRGPSARVDRFGSAAGGVDVISVPSHAPPNWRRKLLLHEVAHLVLGHVPVDRNAGLERAAPTLAELLPLSVLSAAMAADPEAMHQASAFRGCGSCDQTEEREAEAFAERLRSRLEAASVPHAVEGSDARTQELARRVDNMFGAE
jgi:hypothetical protein